MKLSIIVCTRNRADRLEPCFRSIEQAVAIANLRSNVELIVVDNASNDDTKRVVEEFSAKATIKIVYLFESRTGLSIARNSGISIAHGNILVFTDDDCVISKSYIEEAIAFVSADTDLVMRSGSVLLGNPDDLPLTIKPVDEIRRWKRPMDLKSEGDILGRSLIGCNMVVPRAIIDLVGGFDVDLGAGSRFLAAEDTDFFYRAYLKGITLEIVPNLVVWHHHGRRDLISRRKLLRSYAFGNGALAAKYLFTYPRFSRHLYWSGRDAIISYLANKKEGNSMPLLESFIYMLWGAINYGISRLVPGAAS